MKTYFTTEPMKNGYQIVFLDQLGQKLLLGDPHPSVPAAIKAFEEANAGRVVYLNWDAFCKRLDKIEEDRAKIRAWKEWAV